MSKATKGLFLFLFSAVLCAAPVPLHAWTTLCGRAYIVGLEKEHETGLGLLGQGLVHRAEGMSLYITVGNKDGEKTLYIQSNYSYKNGPFPQKIGTNEEADLSTLLKFIHDPYNGTPFDDSHLTFFADPSFLSDPVWGKFQCEMGGTIHVLGPDGRVSSTYTQQERPFQEAPLKFYIPPGWVDAKTGSPEMPLSSVPPAFRKAASKPGCRLFAFDPNILPGGSTATMTLEENPIGKERLVFLKNLHEYFKKMSGKPGRKVYEYKAYTIVGKRVFRVLMDRESPGEPAVRLLEYYFLDGPMAATLTFITDIPHFQSRAAVFQESLRKTFRMP